MPECLKLSVWSGPRNVSTALMYSFRQRPDTLVVDEPLYGHYLRVTSADHPGGGGSPPHPSATRAGEGRSSSLGSCWRGAKPRWYGTQRSCSPPGRGCC